MKKSPTVDTARLRALRVRLDLAYAAVAKEAGVSSATIYRLCEGSVQPQERSAYKVQRWMRRASRRCGVN